MHGTINLYRTGAPQKISQLRLMIRKVREEPAITRKELQEDLKAAETTVTQNNKQLIVPQSSPFLHQTRNSFAKK